jgi:hypothetical protein
MKTMCPGKKYNLNDLTGKIIFHRKKSSHINSNSNNNLRILLGRKKINKLVEINYTAEEKEQSKKIMISDLCIEEKIIKTEDFNMTIIKTRELTNNFVSFGIKDLENVCP